MATSIEDIDFKLLASSGIKYVAFDADSTLVPYMGVELSQSTKDFLAEKKALFKHWCIASNRVTNDLNGIATDLQAGVIRADLKVRKPRRAFYERVLNYFDAKPDEVVMIGDKLLADIWGGKRAGLTTVWVERLGRDGPFDTIIRLRHFERKLLKKYQ